MLPTRNKSIFSLCLTVLICSAIVYIIDPFYIPIKAAISLFQLTVAFFILFKGKIYVSFFLATTSLYILYIIDISLGNIVSIAFGQQISEVFYGSVAGRLAVCAIVKILDATVFYFVYKMFSKVDYNMPYKNWILYDIIISVFMIMSVVFMFAYGSEEYSRYYSILFLLISMIFFIMSIIVMYFFTEICASFQKEKRLYILEEGNKSKENALAVQNQTNIMLRKLRHDLKKHVDNALILINTGDNGSAQELLAGICERINSIGIDLESCTENNLIDSVIAYKKIICESKEIKFNYVLEPLPELHIELSDLSSLFSNLLDNAIEAAEKSSNPTVGIKVFTYKSYLTVSVTNTFAGELNGLKTQKADKSLHGFGISIIEDIAKKYNGMFNWRVNGAVFTANVMIIY